MHAITVVAILAIIVAGTMGGLYVNELGSVKTVTLNQTLTENNVSTLTTTAIVPSILTITQTQTATNDIDYTTTQTDVVTTSSSTGVENSPSPIFELPQCLTIGAGNYVQGAGNSTYVNVLTITAWIFVTSLANNYQVIFSTNQRDVHNNYEFRYLSNGSIEFDYATMQGALFQVYMDSQTGAVIPNSWIFLAVTKDSLGNINFYVNGTQSGSTILGNSNIYFTVSGWAIGASNGGGFNDMNAYVNDVRVYNTNLNASQISAIYSSGIPSCQQTSA